MTLERTSLADPGIQYYAKFKKAPEGFSNSNTFTQVTYLDLSTIKASKAPRSLSKSLRSK